MINLSNLTVDELWKRTCSLYRKLGHKGSLAITGCEPEVEIEYYYGSEYVLLSSGNNLFNAISGLYLDLEQEAKDKIQEIRAKAEADINELSSYIEQTHSLEE